LHIVDKAEVKVKVKIMYIEITSPLLYVVWRTHEYPVIVKRWDVETWSSPFCAKQKVRKIFNKLGPVGRKI
jgi:hypothetical protein